MTVSRSEHTSRPWRIHELTSDFRLEDVWALPVTGGPDDLARLVDQVATGDPARDWPAPVRALWQLRWWIGRVMGWDRREADLGARVPTLRERLPIDLRDRPTGPAFDRFTPLYLLNEEFAAEIANQTVHAVMHIGWVRQPDGDYRGQMAVLVKPNGLFGDAYMAAIKPFRYLIVYPAMLRQIESAWRAADADRVAAHT